MSASPSLAGANVVPRGAELQAGLPALGAGLRLGGAEIAVAAAVGAATVEVIRRPEVAILSTGDELVDVGATLSAYVAGLRGTDLPVFTVDVDVHDVPADVAQAAYLVLLEAAILAGA